MSGTTATGTGNRTAIAYNRVTITAATKDTDGMTMIGAFVGIVTTIMTVTTGAIIARETGTGTRMVSEAAN